MPRYLYRMLVFSLLLSAIPVISIGLISYYIASKDIEQKVNEGNVQILLQNQMRMEQILKNVEIGAVQYINSSLVSDGIYDNLQHDEFQTINNLSKGLYNLHSISGVADTRLINLEHRWMISNLGFTSSQEFANQDVLSQYASRKQNLFWLAETDNAVGGNKIRLVVKLPMIASSTVPKALLLIDISQDALLSNLEQNTQLGTIYVLNRDREPFLASSATNRVQPAILQRLQAAADPAGSFETDSLAVNYKISSYNGWSYVSIVSIDAITKESKKIALITLNGCIIIFIIIAFAAFFGTRRMYRPIGRLFRMMEQVGGESQDSRKQDEFTLIEERFSSLFSTRKQLQQQLHVQRGQVKEFFLLKLLMGQVTESEFSYKYETYGFGEKGKMMGVLALQIDTLEGTRFLDSDKELLLFAINNVVAELIPGDRILGTLLLDQSQVTLLLGDSDDPAELKSYFYQVAEQMKAKVSELLKIKISIGISRPFHKYTHAMDAYQEALEALKRRISLGNELLLSYEDTNTVHTNSVQPAASWNHLEESMISGLKAGDSAVAYDYYNQYASSILENSVSFNDFQIFNLQLIAKIYRLVQQQGGTLDGLVGSKSVVIKFMKLHTAEEIMTWFKTELLPPTVAFFQSRIDSQYINIAQQMVELIHEKYDQDITLESCAEQFRFHPVYLSRVFKKEVGTTFIDYLMNYRMNMAKIWLKDSDMKITEIAERLNYTNSTGFIRTFRKSTGMTPGQYREAHAKS
ncbi:helix-turn-helix domain-containing protein [Paenibacillus thalictri]|uniref:AraC family transcriptional regulator n=1 Tax=Paenibacillus thalictri TaxID=2527873 RepID=A0A4Q9DIU1_9BACL|nr:helix-turn-helix domain-containing protein [Paenibacillus thalictri]TBL71163.1 AraC family transcriptional regulator [Paenibacillus thalictri]